MDLDEATAAPTEETTDFDQTRSRRRGLTRPKLAILIVVALALGVIGRTLATGDLSTSFLTDLLPWMKGTTVDLYFGDDASAYLIPVSRTLHGDDESPEGLLAALLAGPADGIPLVSLLPADTTFHSVSLTDSTMTVDLSGSYVPGASPLADEALAESLASWPGVETVHITVDGEPLDLTPSTGHLLFFYDRSRDMLLAEPTAGESARDVLTAYLAGPGDTGLMGLPDDVQVLDFHMSPGSKLLQLNLAYTPQLRELALGDGDAMRRVLEGLMTTLTTGFPDIHFLYLDFDGHATLGLGQCADLLRRVQPPPQILNDERLLGALGGV